MNEERRQFLRLMGRLPGGLAAAGLGAWGNSAVAGQVPSAPQNVRVGSKAVLQPADLRFSGWFRLPTIGAYPGYDVDFMFTHGAFASRTVAGQLRFFISASQNNGFKLVEIADPQSYTATLSSSTPKAQLVRLWGDPYLGGRVSSNTQHTTYVHGYRFEPPNRLWWQYGTSYNASSLTYDPSVGVTVLNDVDGSMVRYGPWRTSVHSQKTRGWMVEIPSWFADAYVGGRRVALSSDQSSGYQTTNYGPSLFAAHLPALSAPPDPASDNTVRSIDVATMAMFDATHRLLRPGTYRRWEGPYSCGSTSTDVSSLTVSNMWVEELDRTCSGIWVDLPDKHGMITFGGLCMTWPGYSAPNDPEGLIHTGYGDPFGGGRSKTCCHGQDDPWWAATGPFSHAVVPHVFIQDPLNFVPVLQGQAEPWSRPPTHVFPLNQTGLELSSHPSKRAARAWAGTPAIDPLRRLLFVPVAGADRYSGTLYARWAVAVFQIA